MAKKKTQQHSHNLKPQHQQPPPPPPPPTTMDDAASASSQIQNLKNLNSMLLKETADRRNQLDSLVEANRSLQSKLDRSAAVDASLSAAADKAVSLEVERGVLLAFAETRAMEMGLRLDEVVQERNDAKRAFSERENDVVALEREVKELALRLEDEKVRLSSVSDERDAAKRELVRAVGEAEKLREKVLEAESRERKVKEESEKLRLEMATLVEEGKQREREIGEMKIERDLALRSREECDGVIEKLKEEIVRVSREKNEIEKMKSESESRIAELELEMKKLDESLKISRRGEETTRERIRELEGTLGVAMEKGEGMEIEVRALLQEKEEMEKRIEVLNEKRDDAEKVVDMVRKELEGKLREIDEAVRARDEIEQEKVQLENEIAEMQGEVDRIRDVAENFKKSCSEFEEKNKQLVSEIERYRGYVDEAVLEKDNIRKTFDEEKSKVEKLLLQVAGIEERIKLTEAELEKTRGEREKLTERNKVIESRVGILVNEKDVLQRSLTEAQRESGDLRAKVEFSGVNSSMALDLLKNTAALMRQDKEGVEEEAVSDGSKKLEEDVQPFAEELDAIRNAFRSKNVMVDDMKKQLESLHKSVAEAHKSRSLWTLVSSATTIFAAVVAAYAARGR